MRNWVQVHTFAAVCKFWRYSSLPHLYHIEKVLIYGGAEHRLNVGAFLRFFAIKAFQKCAVYFYPLWENKGIVCE